MTDKVKLSVRTNGRRSLADRYTGIVHVISGEQGFIVSMLSIVFLICANRFSSSFQELYVSVGTRTQQVRKPFTHDEHSNFFLL